MIRVILCDDHAMVRRGIRDTLSEAVDIQVTAEAGSYAEVRDAIRTSACDVLVLDLSLPVVVDWKFCPACGSQAHPSKY